MDQTGLGEQLLDRGHVGLPHIRRNGLTFPFAIRRFNRIFVLALSRPSPTSMTTPRTASLTMVA